jgi:hypothetical protein
MAVSRHKSRSAFRRYTIVNEAGITETARQSSVLHVVRR